MDRMGTGSSHLSMTMGMLCGIGGLAGFLKTGSAPSLIAGVGIGGLYFYGSHLINGGQSDIGHKVNLGAAVLLAGSMVPRYLKTKKIWPPGIMAVAGVLSAIYEAKKTLEWM